MTDAPIAAAPSAVTQGSRPAGRWRPEPNASVALRWGAYRSRQPAGLLLIGVGALLVLPASADTLGLALLGSMLHVAGWVVLPARGRRRAWAAGPSLLALWFTVLGARTLFILALPLLLWLVVRRRPWLCYPLAGLPVLANILAVQRFGIFDRQPVVLAGIVSVVLAAWIAAFAARGLGYPSKRAHSEISPVET